MWTGIIDYCIYDTGEIIPEFIKRYNLEGQDIVEQDIYKIKGIKFLQRNLSSVNNKFIRHDPDLVASSIIELICDDLKYQDKQNDPQYLMLNTKLQEEKRINKKKKDFARRNKNGKKKVENNRKGKSKFSNKYSDRIASIREADEKARKKMEKELAKKKASKLSKTTNKTIQSKKNDVKTEIKPTKPKSARGRGRRKSTDELREEMLKSLNDSL